MEYYTCNTCHKEISINEKETHTLVCNNAIREEEFLD